MNIPYSFRQCSKCGKFKIINNDNFAKYKKGKFGYTRRCKECIRKQSADYRNTNKTTTKTVINGYLTKERRKELIRNILYIASGYKYWKECEINE